MTRLGSIALAALASGCMVTDINDSALETPTGPGASAGSELEWRTQLVPVEMYSSFTGDTRIQTGAGDRAFKASITIRNDEPSKARGWRVFYGTCGLSGPLVGERTSYPRLSTGSSGEATTITTIPMALDTTADYHVSVYYSDDAVRLLACGDLVLQ